MLKLKEEIFSIAFKVCSDCDDGISVDIFVVVMINDPVVVISQEAAE